MSFPSVSLGPCVATYVLCKHTKIYYILYFCGEPLAYAVKKVYFKKDVIKVKK